MDNQHRAAAAGRARRAAPPPAGGLFWQRVAVAARRAACRSPSSCCRRRRPAGSTLAAAPLPAPDRDAPLEHGAADARRHARSARCSASRAAWCVERTDAPVPALLDGRARAAARGARLRARLRLDLARARACTGYWGSVLVMTLGSYPLVYLPVAAALRGADPSLEDVARGLGPRPVARRSGRVTLHQIRPALLGGSLLVALILLAEFGTFEILRFQTFTTEIYTEFQIGFDTPAALRALARARPARALLLGAEAAARGRSGHAPSGASSARPADADRGSAGPRLPVLLGLAGLLGLALGVPLVRARLLVRAGDLVDAAVRLDPRAPPSRPPATARPPRRSRPSPRCRSRCSPSATESRARVVLERSTYIVQALPGLVVALAFVYFSVRYAAPALPVEPRAGRRVRDHVLPARARRGPRRRRAGAARARGGRALARARPALGARPRDAAAARAGARGRRSRSSSSAPRPS